MKKLSKMSMLFLGILFFSLEVKTMAYYSRPTKLENGTYVWGCSKPLTRMDDGTYTFEDKQITFRQDGSYIVRFSSGEITEVFPYGSKIENIFTNVGGTKRIVYSDGSVEIIDSSHRPIIEKLDSSAHEKNIKK